MADRTLTINHADGGSETYTIKRDKFAGVRSMSVDGDTVTVDRTAVPKEQSKETTFGGSKSITVKREIEPLLSKVVGGASAAYSLRDLNDKAGNTKVVRVRRASDNCERDFRAKEVKDIATWVNTQTVSPLDLQELDADGHRTGDLVEAAAAYSLRNLSASYTGSVVEVRRSSDDAEESFTAAEVADGTLVAWVGAGNNGFVSQWYDQSGNNNHATQGTDASQPKIVDGGSLVSGGMEFDGANTYLTMPDVISSIDSASSFVVGKFEDIGATGTMLSLSGYSNNKRFYSPILTGGNMNFGYSDSASKVLMGAVDTDNHLFTAIAGAVNANAWLDGVGGTQVASSSGYNANRAAIGAIGAGNAVLEGEVAEVIVYSTDQSDNRTAIEANIGDHYDIDLPSGVDTGYDQVDGFVETWYDQSGNGNDAVQQVSGNQPKIVDAGVLVSGGMLSDGAGTFLELNSTLSIGDEFDIFFTGTATASNWTSLQRSPYGFSANSDYPRFNDDSFRYKIANTDSAQVNYNGGFTIGTGTPFLYNFNRNAADSVGAQINGTAQTNRVTLSGTHSISQLFRRGANTTQVWDGTMSEMIFYPSDQSANRVAIETNINNQYDIY